MPRAMPMACASLCCVMVGHARLAAVHLGPAKLLRRHYFPYRRLDERRPARKMVPFPFTMMLSSHMAGT